MKNTLETRLGIFFVLAIIAGILVLEMSGLDWFKKGYALYADFRDVHELKVGDPVKMSGVKVGKVDNIKLDGDHVRVRLRRCVHAHVCIRAYLHTCIYSV